VCSLPLGADEHEHLRGDLAGVAEGVGCVGVELGGLAGLEFEIVVTQQEAHLAVEDVDPFVAFVGLGLERLFNALRNGLLPLPSTPLVQAAPASSAPPPSWPSRPGIANI